MEFAAAQDAPVLGGIAIEIIRGGYFNPAGHCERPQAININCARLNTRRPFQMLLGGGAEIAATLLSRAFFIKTASRQFSITSSNPFFRGEACVLLLRFAIVWRPLFIIGRWHHPMRTVQEHIITGGCEASFVPL
jgi:hypothetical protein